MNVRRIATVFTALGVILSGCSGSQGGALIPSSLPGAREDGAKAVPAKLQIALKIPHRRGHFVSPSTKSMTISEGRTSLGTFDTTPKTKGCSNLNGSTLCRFTVGITTGKQTFTVKTYDNTGGRGKMLSSGRVTQKIATGLNVIGITLEGVVHSIAVATVGSNLPAGTAATIDLNVMAKDPDGNVIIAPGNYGVPITLSDSDGSGITSLSTTKVKAPDSTVSLAYNGHSITSATIGVSAPGVAASNATGVIFAPTPTDVANHVPPQGPGGASMGIAAITTASDGTIWFSEADSNYDPSAVHFAIGKMATDGTFTIYTTGVPSKTISGIVPGPDGNIWYVDDGSVGNINPTSGTVTDHPLTGSGICASPHGNRIVTSADGGLWVNVSCTSATTAGQIVHVSTTGSFTATTLSGFSFPKGGNSGDFGHSGYSNGLVLGKDAKLYVAGEDIATTNAAVAQLTVAGTSAALTSMADIPGTNNGHASPSGIAQSADGDFWVGNTACVASIVARIHPATPFSSSAVNTYTPHAGCDDPEFLRALPDGTLWVPEWGYEDVMQIRPAVYPAAPTMTELIVAAPYGIFGSTWDVTLGSNGNLFFSSFDASSSASSSSIVEVAY